MAAELGCAPVYDCQPYAAPGTGLNRNGAVRWAQDQGSGCLTPGKGWHPRAQDMICQPGATRGSCGKEQRFSQRGLVQGNGLIYSRGISSQLRRESPVGAGAGAVGAQPPGRRTPFHPRARTPRGTSSQGKLALDGPLTRGRGDSRKKDSTTRNRVIKQVCFTLAGVQGDFSTKLAHQQHILPKTYQVWIYILIGYITQT